MIQHKYMADSLANSSSSNCFAEIMFAIKIAPLANIRGTKESNKYLTKMVEGISDTAKSIILKNSYV